MAKRRRQKQDDSGGGFLPALIFLAVVGGIGSYVIKALAWAAVIVAVVLCTLLGTLVLDLLAIALAKSRGESRGFEATSSAFALVAYPFRLIGRALGWLKGPPLRVATIGELLALSPAQFEEAVATLLRDHGYRDVRRVGGSGDLGVDLTCRDRDGRSVAVQCKRYVPGSRVGSKDLQLFIGMTHVHHRVDRGIYVTTSSFTQPAIDLAKRHRIELIDGQRLARLLPNGVGAAAIGPKDVVELDQPAVSPAPASASASRRATNRAVVQLLGEDVSQDRGT